MIFNLNIINLTIAITLHHKINITYIIKNKIRITIKSANIIILSIPQIVSNLYLQLEIG